MNFSEYTTFDEAFASLDDDSAMVLVALSRITESMTENAAMFSVDMKALHAICDLTPLRAELAVLNLAGRAIAGSEGDRERMLPMVSVVCVERIAIGGEWVKLTFTMPKINVGLPFDGVVA